MFIYKKYMSYLHVHVLFINISLKDPWHIHRRKVNKCNDVTIE